MTDVYRDIAILSGEADLIAYEGDSRRIKSEITEVITDGKAFKCVEDVITDQSRWTTMSRQTYKHVESGRYFQRYHSYGSTEMQDGQDYDDNDDWTEVYPQEVTVIQYVEKAGII